MDGLGGGDDREIVASNSGTSFLDLLAAYEELVGKDVVDAARAKLSLDAQREIEVVTPLSWVPVAIVGDLIDRVAEEAGQDAEVLLDRAVRRATQRTLATVWRVMLRFTSDDALVARTPLFYAKSRNKGRLLARKTAPGRAEIELVDWPDVSARHIRTIAISIATVVEAAGRGKVDIAWLPSRGGATYHVSWARTES